MHFISGHTAVHTEYTPWPAAEYIVPRFLPRIRAPCPF